jgi:hypothetical protein
MRRRSSRRRVRLRPRRPPRPIPYSATRSSTARSSSSRRSRTRPESRREGACVTAPGHCSDPARTAARVGGGRAGDRALAGPGSGTSRGEPLPGCIGRASHRIDRRGGEHRATWRNGRAAGVSLDRHDACARRKRVLLPRGPATRTPRVAARNSNAARRGPELGRRPPRPGTRTPPAAARNSNAARRGSRLERHLPRLRTRTPPAAARNARLPRPSSDR